MQFKLRLCLCRESRNGGTSGYVCFQLTLATSAEFYLDSSGLPDLSLIQQEVDALEELSRQLFLETADLHATKVQSKELD